MHHHRHSSHCLLSAYYVVLEQRDVVSWLIQHIDIPYLSSYRILISQIHTSPDDRLTKCPVRNTGCNHQTDNVVAARNVSRKSVNVGESEDIERLLLSQTVYATTAIGTVRIEYTHHRFHQCASSDFCWCDLDAASLVSSKRVRSNNPSRPVGCSGAKNVWGRSHDPSPLPLFCTSRPGLLLVGVQSIASASGSGWGVLTPVEGSRDGTPKTGRVGDITGCEDSERAARRSGSGIGLGAGDARCVGKVGSGV